MQIACRIALATLHRIMSDNITGLSAIVLKLGATTSIHTKTSRSEFQIIIAQSSPVSDSLSPRVFPGKKGLEGPYRRKIPR